MKPHIRYIAQKPMATGSAWGRLLTIAFLCLTTSLFVFAGTAEATNYNLTVTKTVNGGEPGIQSNFVIQVTPNLNPDQSINLVYYTEDGSATAVDNDYSAIPDTAFTLNNLTLSVNVVVNTLDDILVEGPENFDLAIKNVVFNKGVAIMDTLTILTDRDTASIADDDLGDVAIGIGDPTAGEPADDGQFMLMMSNPSSTDTLVSFTVGGTATGGSDFTLIGTSMTVPAGATLATIDIEVLDDLVLENDETVTVTLTGTDNPNIGLGFTTSETLTITDNDSAAVSVDDVTAVEGGGLLFTVSLDNAVQGGFDVTTGYTDVTTAAGDFDHTAQVLNFAGTVGETQQFTVTTADDAVLEGSETFTVTLTASNAQVDDSDTGTGTITDNDSAAVSVDDVTAVEGGGLLFTVSLDNAVQGGFDVTTGYTDVTTAAGDFDHTAQVLNFAGTVGETQQFTVTTTDDAVLEGSETFTVTLTASNAQVDDSDTGTGTITDNDSAAVSVDDVTAVEGGGLLFTVSLDNAVQGGFDVTTGYTDVTTAAGDFDHTAQVLNFAGTVGETQQFTVTTADDAVLEGSETFTVTLTASNAQVDDSDTGTGTITDNDSAAVSVDDVTAVEGGGLLFTVSLDNAVQGGFDVTTGYTDVTTAAGDFDHTAQVLNFAGTAGETQQFTVTTADDAVLEGSETFTVTLTASNAQVDDSDTGTGTITDNDSAAVSVDDVTAVEGGGLLFTVSLDNAVQGGFDVTTGYTDVTTAAGDFNHTAQVLNFAGTVGETQQFTVTTADDAVLEGSETFTVTLTASNAQVDDSDTGTGTITDNDSAAVSVDDVTAVEGGGLLFTVSLDNAVQGGFDVTTGYTDVTTAAGDFDHTAQVLNFAGTVGETQQFTVTTADDAVLEGSETFTVTLTASNAQVDDSDTGTGTITDNDSAAVSVDDVTAVEGGGLLFTVSLDNAVQGGFDVTTGYTDVTTAAGDFDHTAQVLNFAGTVGETQQFTVTTADDAVLEGSETFTVTLTASNAQVDDSDTGTGTITDNDSAAVSVDDVTAVEGGGLLFTVSLDNAVQGGFDVTTGYTDVTTAAGDFDHTAQVLNFAGTVGETQQFTVTTADDAVLEGSETFTVTLTASNAQVDDSDTGTGTITDNDSAAVSVDDVTAVEGGGLLFTVSLDNAVQGGFDVTTGYTDVTTAAGDFDHTAQVLNFAGTVGETQQFTVTTADDAVLEGSETFTVTLTASNAQVDDSDTGTGTITDNDSAAVSVDDVTAVEGGGLLFTVSLDNAVQGGFDVTTGYTDVTTAAGDFDHTAQVLNFAGTAGETQQFTVTTADDAVLEGSETFTVTLTASNAQVDDSDTGTGTITDNDSAAVSVDDVTAVEGGGLLFTVSLDNAVQGGFDVTTGYTDVTTAAGDFNHTAQVLNFTGTVGETQQFTVATTDDAVLEGSETFTVTLTASNAQVDDSDTGTGTITDNDTGDVVISANDASAAEPSGNNGQFTVTMSNLSSTATTISYTITGSATGGSDYAALAGSIDIPANSTTATIDVTVIDDSLIEGAEAVILTLTGTSNGSIGLGTTISDTVTIADDDATTVSISATDASAAEPSDNGLFTVSLGAGLTSTTDTVIDMTVSGTATNGTDFAAIGTSVTIPAGSNSAFIDVTVTNDTVVEGDETVVVTLDSVSSSTSGITIGGTNSATVTIADNDATLTLTVVSPFGGSTVTPAGTTSYDLGTVVPLTATAGLGEIFSGWSGDITDTANPTTITIDGNKSVTATFDKQAVTLNMQVSFLEPGAFGTVTPDIGPHPYLWGDTVSVTATPDAASTEFVGWSPNVVGGVVTMNGDQTVIATFDLKTFTVTFQAGPDGTLDDGSTTADTIVQNVKWGYNSTVVTGVADVHYHFLEWVNDADGTVMGTDPNLQAIHVIENLNFTGNFEIDKFTLTFNGGNFGDVEVGGTSFPVEYQEIVDWNGSSSVVTALPDDQNQFQGWTGTGGFTSSDLAIQIDNVDQDMTFTFDTVPVINGCATDVSVDYSSGFDPADFSRVNVDVDAVSGNFTLNTGNQGIDPDSIIIPFKQDVYVTFLYEGAGFKQSDFGWIFASEGKNGVKHEIYGNINDDAPRDGILDGMTDRNGDGVIDRHDNKVYLGTIDGGTEIVFYLDARDNGCGGWCGDIFFTKRDWNDHDLHGRCTGTSGIAREIRLYQDGGEGDTNCYNYVAACGAGVRTQGWMDAAARIRLNNDFGFNFRAPTGSDPPGFNTECIDEPNGTASTHAIVGAPDETPFAWVIGFDDTTMDDPAKSNDYDYNDVVFLIERKTGGMAQLEVTEAIVPNEANAYFTGLTLDVWDYLPGGACLDKTQTTYYVSANGGAAGSWIEVTAWDKVNESDAAKTIGAVIDPVSWTPGNPEYTYRSRRIDLAGLGLTGNQLIWKVELISEDEDCVPEVLDVQIDADTASHGFFARSSPVVQTNVIYAGNYETPEPTWTERINRGHLTASRLYDPEVPDSTLTGDQTLWDAGTELTAMNPDSRTIYYPNITVVQVTDEALLDASSNPILGDGATRTFSGTLAYHPVAATTVRIYDDQETFTDRFTDDLQGNFNGSGTIKRFTGEWTVTFQTAPMANVPIKASYSYYSASSTLVAFSDANVNNAMLALNNDFVWPTGFVHDFNGDNLFTEADADWLVQWMRGYRQPNSSLKKEWLLGPIDHSTAAVLVPPGFPLWYFGSQVTDAEREQYEAFRTAHDDRDTVVFVGSRDGMLHAFDGGKFRYGDNPETTGIEEHRGYFLWEPKTGTEPSYCDAYTTNCPNYGTGQELWAFIPANLLPRLKNNLLKADDQAFVDASPALADAYIDTNANGLADTWKTVLLSAEGNGGDTVFCLDVTDPHNPTFMWEFAAPELFRSRSSPAVAQIGRIHDPLTNQAKWVAFFVTGKVENASLFPAIYMIDISTGSVLHKVVLDDAVDLDGSGIIDASEVDYGRGGVPSGQPAVVDSDENGYIDRMYLGTDKGLMYKINIPDDPQNTNGNSVTHCVLNIDFVDEDFNTVAAGQRWHPIYASPAIVVDNNITPLGDIEYNVMVFFGTGDSPYYDENINTSTTRYHFFAYTDTSDKMDCTPSNHKLEWFLELDEGHRIFASAFAAAGQLYFGTSTSETEDPCEGHLEAGGNEGRIYAVTLDGVVLLNKVVGDMSTSPLVEDEHLYFRTPTGLQSMGSGVYNNEVQAAGTPTINFRSWREVID